MQIHRRFSSIPRDLTQLPAHASTHSPQAHPERSIFIASRRLALARPTEEARTPPAALRQKKTWTELLRALRTPFWGKEGLTSYALLGAIVPTFVYASTPAVKLGVLAFTAVTLFEYCKVTLGESRKIIRNAAMALGMTFATTLTLVGREHIGLLFYGALVVSAAFALRFGDHDRNRGASEARKTFLACGYIAFLFSHLGAMHGLAHGNLWVAGVLVVNSLGDMMAKSFGKAWGKDPLIPKVSPGKTRQGLMGQILGTSIAALLWTKLVMPEVATLADAAALGLLACTLGPIGDLFESLIKRAAKTKDASHILPGHGGLLDRVDGLLFVAPAVYYYLTLIRPLL